MIFQKEIYKAYWLLRNFTPGQLQAFVLVDTPFKSGRGDEAPITVKPKRVQSTKIPASTIHRFQSGEYTPHERSIKKLAKFYNKLMYNKLRATGASKKDARTCRTMDPEKITPYLKNYRKWAKQILKNYQSRCVPFRRCSRSYVPPTLYQRVTLSHILWGMAHSVKYGYNDWAVIAMTSGLKKRPQFKKSKRAGKYEH